VTWAEELQCEIHDCMQTIGKQRIEKFCHKLEEDEMYTWGLLGIPPHHPGINHGMV